MTNEKDATPSHIVVTELDTLITRLTDAAFDCGDYDDSKSGDGYKILFDAEQKAIDDLKTYVATIRAEEKDAAISIVRACSTRDELHPDISITVSEFKERVMGLLEAEKGRGMNG